MKKATLTKSTFLIFVCLLFSIQPLLSDTPRMEFITDGIVKLGINKQWGGGIGYFSRLGGDSRNVINYMDRGRNIQQSFYGSKDSNIYDNWRFNPVQGGDAHGYFSKVISKVNYGDAIYVKTKPLDWKPYKHLAPLETSSYMEQWITLREGVAQIVYRFKYYGNKTHVLYDQEMPAAFFIKYLSTLAYYKNGAIRYKYSQDIPINNGDGYGINAFLTNHEDWAAFVNNTSGKWGCGIFTPSTNRITYYKSTGPGGSSGFGASYFAPLGRHTLKPNFNVKYTAYLFIANVKDIRTKFNNIRINGLQLVKNGGFEKKRSPYHYPTSWGQATDGGGSHQYYTNCGEWVYKGKCSVALIAQSAGNWELPYYIQTINGVTGNTKYRIKFRVKCANLFNGSAGIRIIQFRRNGTLISDSGIISASRVSGDLSNFKYKEFLYKLNSATFKIQIRLQLNSLDAWAKVAFDNVVFTLANP